MKYLILVLSFALATSAAAQLPAKVQVLLAPSSWVVVEDTEGYQRLVSGSDIAERTLEEGVPQTILALVNDTVYVKLPTAPIRVLHTPMVNNFRRNFQDYKDLNDAISLFPAIRDSLDLTPTP